MHVSFWTRLSLETSFHRCSVKEVVLSGTISEKFMSVTIGLRCNELKRQDDKQCSLYTV